MAQPREDLLGRLSARVLPSGQEREEDEARLGR